MKYFLSEIDSFGNTYSIDNLILEYIIKTHVDFISYLQQLNNKYDLKEEYWEKLNVPYCSKYQFYNNHIHLCNGIYIMVGKYDIYSYLSQTHNIFPVVKLEINPNKHFEKPIFKELLQYLKDNTGDCTLKRYDFCIDIKCNLSDIEVFGSRKEKGLYKGTRYYGQRNKDGYLKIYDKGKEQGLEYDLTRVEYTLVNQKRTHQKHGFNFQDVYILSQNKNEYNQVSNTIKCICKLYNMCLKNGCDPSDLLNDLDKRTKKKVIESLGNSDYILLKVEEEKLNILLDKIKSIFNVVEQKHVYVDKDGFLKCDCTDLPFD